MLKDTDKYERKSEKIKYNEYKRKSTKSSNKDIMIFISVFIVGVLIILGFARILSPNVDVGIQSNDDNISTIEDENIENSSIDERLKRIKMEDEEEAKIFTPELEEKVVLPNSENETTTSQSNAQVWEETEKNIKVTAPSEYVSQQTTKAPVASETPNIRVVIGSYTTEEQAKVAKSIMHDAGLNIVPIIKNIGGVYTLQVGVYSSHDKAQQVLNGLLKNNFPARIISE